jgi:hypothetical protein
MSKTNKEKAPKNYYTYHHPDCGTKYRGCSPKCPADIYEQTGKWTGQKDMAERLKHLKEEITEIEKEILLGMQIKEVLHSVPISASPSYRAIRAALNGDHKCPTGQTKTDDTGGNDLDTGQ